MFAMTLMVNNRVPVAPDINAERNTVAATHLPLNIFLPSDGDWDVLRERMVVIVSRILRENIPTLRHISVCKHIEHQYSKDSAKRSEWVSRLFFFIGYLL